MRQTGSLEWPRRAGWMGGGGGGGGACAIAVPFCPVTVLNDLNLELVLLQMHSCGEGGGGGDVTG